MVHCISHFLAAILNAENLSCLGLDDMSEAPLLENTIECAEDFKQGRSPLIWLLAFAQRFGQSSRKDLARKVARKGRRN